MRGCLEEVEGILEGMNEIIWGPWMLVLFMGTGLFSYVQTAFLAAASFGLCP